MQLNKSVIFLIWALSFVGGVFVESFWTVNLFFGWLFLIGAIIIILLNYRNRKIIVFSGVMLIFLLGVYRTNVSLDKIENVPAFNKKISVQAKVVQEPIIKGWRQNVIVLVDGSDLKKFFRKNDLQVDKKKFLQSKKIKILLKTDPYQKLQYGDKISLNCLLQIPKNFSDDFDYKMYLANHGIYYTCSQSKFAKVEKSKIDGYGFILKIKKTLEKNISEIIPQPEATLARGLLFGGSGRLPKELQTSFSRTGMTHIVAVSGYNVTIIAEYLMLAGIFLGMWRAQAFYLALFGIFIFVAMIGFPGSAVRAGVMGMIILWAVKKGRLANADNAILFAGVIMLIINPLLLRWDIGFQLSFLATLGIIKISPIWQTTFTDNLGKITWRKTFFSRIQTLGIKEIIFMTISAQMFVLPIILYNFQTLSLISVLVNLFVLPIIPITMLFVFLTAVLGIFFYSLAMVFGWLAFWLLKYEIGVVKIASSFNWASLNFKTVNIFWLILYYLILLAIIYILTRRRVKNIKKIF